jgi:hypothetical protein
MEQIGLHLREGGGQMGALIRTIRTIRTKDGARTTIGPTDAWPQSHLGRPKSFAMLEGPLPAAPGHRAASG